MKRHWITMLVLCLGFIIAGECKAQSLEEIKKEIAETNKVYFERFSKSEESVVDLYAEDGCLYAPYAPAICGRAALTKDFKDTYAAGQIKGVKFFILNIYGDGKEFITEDGTWQVFDKSDKLLDDGKYLRLWKKTKTGWKIYREAFNSNRKHSAV